MLPEQFIQFIADPARRVETFETGEIRRIEFYSESEITKKNFTVSSFDLWLNGPLTEDPEEERTYEGYDLVKAVGGYQPEGVLIWFPDWKEFGTWDCDHLRILTFPETEWWELADDLGSYVNAQWERDYVIHREINPWLAT